MDISGGQALPTASDAELLSASARGDQAAFAELASRHYGPVYRLAWRMLNGSVEAEDVAQETFVKLWVNPHQVRDALALKGWLMRVASNLATDRLRRKPLVDLDTIGEIADANARPDMARDASRRVDLAIARLPDRQKLAVTLVYLEDMTNIAAAVVMELSVDAIESLLARERRSLKTTLADDWREIIEELAAGAG